MRIWHSAADGVKEPEDHIASLFVNEAISGTFGHEFSLKEQSNFSINI